MTALSVIIPAFHPRNFDALERSMAANADVDAEWIVVDDGSGAGYDAVFAALPDGVRLIRLPQNSRQGAARNAGLAQAQGERVKFLDADDQLDKGHLAALLAATGQEMAIPFAPTKHVFANGATHVNDSWRDLPAEPQAQLCRQMVRPFLHHCGALFPRDLLTRLGGYDESLITDEDGDLLLRILHEGWHFVPVDGVHYLYIHHKGGVRVSTDDDFAKMQARIRACDKALARLGDPPPPDLAQALAQRMDKVAMTYWTAFPAEAKALVVRARRIASGYVPDMQAPLRLLRAVGGPGMVFAAQGLYRRLKGRPKGGAQG
jgi:glycosyltransferase involved in cell wall biosynthesis